VLPAQIRRLEAQLVYRSEQQARLIFRASTISLLATAPGQFSALDSASGDRRGRAGDSHAFLQSDTEFGLRNELDLPPYDTILVIKMKSAAQIEVVGDRSLRTGQARLVDRNLPTQVYSTCVHRRPARAKCASAESGSKAISFARGFRRFPHFRYIDSAL
jgi:hypothetical protein